MAATNPEKVITIDPAVRGGRPSIVGTQITVSDLIASHLYRGLSPEELAVNYALSMAEVYAALAYYFDNRATIDAQLRDDEEQAQTLHHTLADQGKLLNSE